MAKEFRSESIVAILASDTAADAPLIEARRARGPVTLETAVTTDGDGILTIVGKGYNGTTYDTAAEIQISVDGTPGTSNDMPGRIVFLTTPDNTATPVERLRIDSTGALVFKGTTSGTVGFKAGATPAGDVVYTLPSADGTIGQVLQTNGSGVLSFVAAGAGGDFANGGDVAGANRTLGNIDAYALGFETSNLERMTILSNGNVGIGTTNPGHKLHVESVAASVQINGTSGSYAVFAVRAIGHNRDVQFTTDNGGGQAALQISYDSTDSTKAWLMTVSSAGLYQLVRPGGSPAFVIAVNGNVGIGVHPAVPTAKLHVMEQGNTPTTTAVATQIVAQRSSTAGASAGISIISGNAANGYLSFGDTNNEYAGYFSYVHSSDSLHTYVNASLRMTILSNGNVGINNTTPSTLLHVAATGSTSTTIAAATQIVAQRSSTTGSSAGISIISGNIANGYLSFGDTDNEYPGYFQYRHSSNSLHTYVNVVERMVIDSAGVVEIKNDIASVLKLNHANNTPDNRIDFWTSRGTIASPTAVVSGDEVGSIRAIVADGPTTARTPAKIRFVIDGTVATNQVPTAITFETSPNSTANRVERMRINNAGLVTIQNDSTNELILDHANATPANHLDLWSSRGTLAARTTLVNGDSIGAIRGVGHDGTTVRTPATINFVVDGTVATNQVPTAITFETSPNSTANRVERMRINKDGVVQVGTTNVPGLSSKLSLEGGADFYTDSGAVRVWDATTENCRLTMNATATTANIYAYDGSNFAILKLGSNAAAPPLLVDGLNSRVGIGTALPLTPLHLSSNVSATFILERATTNATGPSIQARKSRGTVASPSNVVVGDELLKIDGVGYAGGYQFPVDITLAVDSGTISGASLPTRITFSTTPDGSVLPTERMRINKDGFVGIGTTNPVAHINVEAANNAQIRITSLDATTASAASLYVKTGSGSGFRFHVTGGLVGGQESLSFYSNFAGAHRMVVNQAGNLSLGGLLNAAHPLDVLGTAGLSTGTAWTNTSDIRLKDVKSEYTKGLAEIMEIKPIWFSYKEGNAKDLPSDFERVGFSAQEVVKYIPEAVTEDADGYLQINVDPIHTAMLNAIKELAAKNEELVARLEALEEGSN